MLPVALVHERDTALSREINPAAEEIAAQSVFGTSSAHRDP